MFFFELLYLNNDILNCTFLNVLEQFALPCDTIFLHPFPQSIINSVNEIYFNKDDLFNIYFSEKIYFDVLCPYYLAKEQFNLIDHRITENSLFHTYLVNSKIINYNKFFLVFEMCNNKSFELNVRNEFSKPIDVMFEFEKIEKTTPLKDINKELINFFIPKHARS